MTGDDDGATDQGYAVVSHTHPLYTPARSLDMHPLYKYTFLIHNIHSILSYPLNSHTPSPLLYFPPYIPQVLTSNRDISEMLPVDKNGHPIPPTVSPMIQVIIISTHPLMLFHALSKYHIMTYQHMSSHPTHCQPHHTGHIVSQYIKKRHNIHYQHTSSSHPINPIHPYHLYLATGY